MNATAIKLVINLWHDDCADDPTSYDGWSVYSFSSRHHNNKKPWEIGFEYDDEADTFVPDKDLRAKLDSGLAFFLSYYEHGQCAWSLRGEGPQCPWDSVGMAGLLVWEDKEDNIGAKTREDREKDARAFIDRYTEWCNGNVFGYTVEAFRVCECCEQDVELSDEEAGLDLPSVGGYYGDDIDGMVIDMKDNIGSDWKDYDVTFKDNMGGYLADEAKRHWDK